MLGECILMAPTFGTET